MTIILKKFHARHNNFLFKNPFFGENQLVYVR
jgi:hypothetical protein